MRVQTKICPFCGKPIESVHSFKVYCDDRCRERASRLRREGIKLPRPEHPCEQCGITTIRHPYCTDECEKAAKKADRLQHKLDKMRKRASTEALGTGERRVRASVRSLDFPFDPLLTQTESLGSCEWDDPELL